MKVCKEKYNLLSRYSLHVHTTATEHDVRMTALKQAQEVATEGNVVTALWFSNNKMCVVLRPQGSVKEALKTYHEELQRLKGGGNA